MPRALKVVIECDYCSNEIGESEDHEGALTLTINGAGPRLIDLCSDCLTTTGAHRLISVFQGADDIPQVKPKARNTNQSGPAPCPACSHVAGSPQGLGRHTREVHGASAQELRNAISNNELMRDHAS